ncbi:hypothetical protein [Shinella sp. M31]|uniref:hypothetical protein n=1 Tax=Shinella sp. M31 TaxID=3368615 RepID=UPI003BA09B95
MANEIKSAFDSVYADGPSSGPAQPQKSRIRDEVGGTIQAQVDALQKSVDEAKAIAVTSRKTLDNVIFRSTSTGALATAFVNGTTHDGRVAATGERFFMDGRTDPKENGVYLVPAAGAPARTTDADTGAELLGATFYVAAGSSSKGKTYTCKNATAPVIGTDAITFALVNEQNTAVPSALDALRKNANSVATAATIDIDNVTGEYVPLTGDVTVSAVTLGVDRERSLRVDGSPFFKVGALLKGDNDGKDVQMFPGDRVLLRGEAGGIVRFWRQRQLQLVTDDGVDAYRWEDSYGNTLMRIGLDGMVYIGGMQIDPQAIGGDIEFGASPGYTFARLGAKSSMINGIRIDAWPLRSFEIQDIWGHVLWRPNMPLGSASQEPTEIPQPQSLELYLGKYLYAVEGEESTLVVDNILKNRMDAALVQASIFPRTGAAYKARSFVSSTQIKPSDMAGGATLIVRPKSWDAKNASELRLTTRIATLASLTGLTPKILSLTDSIGTYQGLYYQHQAYLDWGVTPTWVGTTPTENNTPSGVTNHFVLDSTYSGECRPGIELADYTNYLTTTLSPVSIGGEAAYLAADTSTKRTFNPLLVIDDGVVDDADLRNGYFIDFAAYFSRFGLAAPDMLSLVLCRNDVRRLNTSSAYALIKAEMALLIRRWRAYSATKPIIFMLPGTARTPDEDLDWPVEIQAYRALLDLQAQIADSRFHICFAQAFVPNDGSFDLTLASTSPNATTGVITRTIEDGIHPYGYAREEDMRQLAMTGAYALTHI